MNETEPGIEVNLVKYTGKGNMKCIQLLRTFLVAPVTHSETAGNSKLREKTVCKGQNICQKIGTLVMIIKIYTGFQENECQEKLKGRVDKV